jgi:hypothetical protein
VHDTRVRRTHASGQQAQGRRWLGGDSLIWLFGVTVLFVAAELTPALLHMPLGADEITYIARTSARASLVNLPPVHGHGAGLLAAPVTLLTTSLTAIRVWMALLSAVGLFLAMLCWRGLRPGWVLALAAAILGSLAITQLSGVQVYPDWWAAIGILALTGLLLQAVNDRWRSGVLLALIGFCAFLIVLMRPQNIFFVLVPAIAAVIFVPDWRKPKVLFAMGVGIALGLADWVGEAFLWYGGFASRVHLAGQEPPKFMLYFSFPYQVKVLSGPWYCLPGACTSWNYPWETLWWVAFAALSLVGLIVAWHRTTKASSLLAAVTAVWVVGCYSLLVPFGAPRYLLPAYALMAILAADAIAWLVTESRWRTVGLALAGVFLITGIVTQRMVLNRQVSEQTATRALFTAEASKLRRLGVRPPCVIRSPSVAYFLGCRAPWTGESMPELLRRTSLGRHGWRVLHRPGVDILVYVPKSKS